MLHLKNSFLNEKGESWVMIIPSVHQLCAHTWELFSLNDSASVAKWSENPLKAWNKHVRSFQSGPSLRALQKSQKNNLRDVLRRMLIRSNPVIASKYPRHIFSVTQPTLLGTSFLQPQCPRRS